MRADAKSWWVRYRKWLLLALGLIALGAAWYFLPVKDWVETFNAWIEQRGAWGYVIFIAAYAIAAVLFFPGSLLTIGAGLAFGLWRGFAVVSVGSTLGAAFAFLIARYFLRDKVQAAAAENPKFGAMDEAIGKGGWKMVALLQLSPLLPFNLSNYLYGAAGKQAATGTEAGPWKWVLFGAGLLSTVIVTIWISRLAKKAVPDEPEQ